MLMDDRLPRKSNATQAPHLRADRCTSCMRDLDSLGWEYGLSFSLYGVRLGVRVTDPELLAPLRSNLPYASTLGDNRVVDRLFSVVAVTGPDSGKARYNLYWDHTLFGLKLDMTGLLDTFNAIATLAFAELSNERLFVHAGVVGWQGKAIVIPGKSHSGKSNLVEALLRHGATYYSDELAVIDERGYVSAYPRPLSLRDGSKHKPQADGGVLADREPLPVGLVVFTQYEVGATWQPQSLTAGNGLLLLLDSTLSAQRNPERAMQVLKQVVRHARIISAQRGEADEVAQGILHDMDS